MGRDPLSSEPGSQWNDMWFDRYLLKRRLLLWRIIALVSAFFLVLSWASWGAGSSDDDSFIARITIDEIILSNQERIALLDQVMERQSAKALLVHINSPGGSMVGSEDIYNRLRQISETKPVVIVMDEIATSGGYLAALGGDWIIAHEGTITGSVGILFQNIEIGELLSKIGVDVQSVRSGTLKARPDIFEKMDAASRQILRGIVDASQNYFIQLVTARRGIDARTQDIVADGRIFSGRQALELGLIDEIGGQTEAISRLEQRGVPEGLPIRDVEHEDDQKLWELFLNDILDGLAGKTMIQERLKLDGLIALWQAEGY